MTLIKTRKVLLVNLVTALCILSLHQASASFDDAAALYSQKNYFAAFTAFEELAEQGDPKAQSALALMYRYGEGNVTTLDEEKSLYWLKQAASQGFDRAIDSLGTFNTQHNPNPNPSSQSKEPLTTWLTDWDFHLPAAYRLGNSIPDAPAKTLPDSDKQYRVQLGAMRTRASARKLWQSLQNSHAKMFESFEMKISLSENQLHRIQTGPFMNYLAAQQFCKKLLATKGNHAGCIALGPR